ncbi:MAG: phosphoheptose isomerase [Candidatus Levybacteria bacterium RIFCSPHIGHO2_12_FULL_38_12]|nr:MAG: phosphoheptose isomerase [Candidatus Levybacteria bacterium RIFCSPHIGHO2_01_FULL_38_12]OGH21724.1 MAG: phosphoheptose isomerase [Candidatus Levybacteria bacterium RIFCSPHIGHO2_02_FULL_37_18]OGH22618.1 MAG: phosphoheptose isomerase [Candidatus Levybacteria bacterium RIFCSPHIGHO2_12_FULL_38_12]OGH33345.1 MAG: phosphoheptose isomerase [Candidatus Levybacteria bacterium RIFCSPLOWO2_01_FULL_37_20]OGH52617.1 MAG: phosphoheptose isomerase [Candidatus Levybacteria bacterium RIFCSPLOWO2_12_FULL_
MTKVSRKYQDRVRKRLLESADVKKKVAQDCLESILAATQLIVDTFESGGKVMICGNGGSAADSQHMAGELICVLNKAFDRPGLPAIALTTDTSILTASANDMGFENVYKRQVLTLGRPGDLLIAISTSGNSPNILAAAQAAREALIHTIALTGKEGKLQKIADVAVCVPSNMTQCIQESHIAIEHIICELVEHHFFGSKIGKNKAWL